MGMNELVGSSLWDDYSQKVSDRMNNPLYKGEISEEEAKEMGCKLIVADFGAESCGDAVRLYWAVDESEDRIKKARFKSFGCGTAIASSDVMVELCLDKTVDEAIKITNIDVELAMRDNPETPAVPPQKMHCSVMAYDVIKKATSIYKGVDMDSLEEEVIVCECARISLSTIKEVTKLNKLTTISEITDYTKAGAFCKSCIKPGGHEKRDYYLESILEETLNEVNQESLEASANAGTDLKGADFSKLTMIQRSKLIDEVMDEKVRPMLAMDSGNIEIVDIKENDTNYDVFVRYLGACDGCASGSTGTLYAIESTLKEDIDENIRVIPV